jgi:hypothetical protein
MSRTAIRAAAASGIAYVVLAASGFAMLADGYPLKDAPDADLAAYFVDGPMARIMAGGYLQVLGFLCFLPFAVGLGRVLHERGTVGDVAAPTTVVAGIAYVSAVIPSMAAGGAAVYLGHHGTTDIDLIRGLLTLRQLTYFASLMTLGSFFGAVAVTALATRHQARWVGASAALLAVSLLVGVALGDPDLPGVVSMLGLVWVVAVSVRLLRTPAGIRDAERRIVAA